LHVFTRLRKNLLSNVNVYFVLFSIAFIVVNVLLIFRFNLLFISIAVTVCMMLIGQMLLTTTLSITYVFYMFSCFSVQAISLLYWIARHVPNTDVYLAVYGLVAASLVAIPLVVHLFTRKRLEDFPMVPTFSIFFVGLLLTLGLSQTIEGSASDTFFGLTMLLFSITSIIGLNMSWRTLILYRELGISDRAKFMRNIKDEFLKRTSNEDTRNDVDLLMYYLRLSLDSFVEGNFDDSFMNAYKIAFDLNGKAFKAIYVLPENKDRQKRFSEIRHRLSHARISEKKTKETKEEKKKDLQKLKDAQKRLFQDNLDILRIVKSEFIEAALKKEIIDSL
jgi:regulator of replication initiation timing